MNKKIFLEPIKKIIRIIFKLKYFRIIGELFSEILEETYLKVKHNDISLKFISKNYLTRWRVQTFSNKEPETLDWIDDFKNSDCVFWDIGANIGIYSCYAAKKKNCKVYAFEPSVFNLDLLAKNIWINNLAEKIIIFPLPLNDSTTENKLKMTTLNPGGSQSTFGKNYGYDGKSLEKIFEFSTLGTSIDEACSFFKIKKPNYIKIDVDGIEHLIIKGGLNTLKNVESVLVEVNDEFNEQNENIKKYMLNSGFVLSDKKHSKMSAGTKYEKTFNQIWMKK